jgi:hypothetical protein
MSHPNKKRGYNVEIWLRDKHLEHGIPCERVPLSGSMGGKYSGDLCIPSVEHPKYICESKARKNGEGFTTIEKWMENKDLLFIKRNRKDPMVVMSFEVYLELIKAYYGKIPASM